MMHILAADTSTFFLPTQGSNLSHGVDWAWNVILGITGFFFIVVVGAMTIFVLKYRRRTPNDETPAITHNTPLEIAWTLVPMILVIAIFFVGFHGFLDYDTPPSNAVPVTVKAHRWAFDFTYPNGGHSSDVLYVEHNVPVVLNMESEDVLHALYVPAFRTQRNLIPFRTTNVWFVPEELSPEEGFDLFCTQYCGQNHSTMHAVVKVDDHADFVEDMKKVANPFKEKDPKTGKMRWIPYVELGHKEYMDRGCAQCHTIDGKQGTGPTWQNLYKSNVAFSVTNNVHSISENDSDQVWDDYLAESMIHPQAKIVSGFGGQMPSFESSLSGSAANDELRTALVDYIKSIGRTPWKPSIPPDSELYDADKHPYHPEWSDAMKKAADNSGAASGPATGTSATGTSTQAK